MPISQKQKVNWFDLRYITAISVFSAILDQCCTGLQEVSDGEKLKDCSYAVSMAFPSFSYFFLCLLSDR